MRATVNLNQFAATLAPLLERYFSSSKQSSIKEIVERAYVSSDEVTEYDRVLESLLKECVLARRGNIVEHLHPERSGEQTFDRTIAKFAKDEDLSRLDRREGHLQLIQGAVGSGKSLFMERYKQTLEPKDPKEKTKWATVDFLSAPVSLSGAENWLCKTFIDSFQTENCDIDFSEMSVLRGIYSRKIQQRKPVYTSWKKPRPKLPLYARQTTCLHGRITSKRQHAGSLNMSWVVLYDVVGVSFPDRNNDYVLIVHCFLSCASFI